MDIVLNIITNNILPIFILILVGFIMGRKFEMDLATLSKLNFYVFVPCFTFVNLYTANLDVNSALAFAAALIMLVINLLVSFGVAKGLRLDRSRTRAFQNSVAFYNSGNIGIPLITLIYSSGAFILGTDTPWLSQAMAAQIMVLVVQNATTNTIGFYNAWSAKVTWQQAVRKVLRMPTIYGVALAFIFRALPFNLREVPGWPALEIIARGLVSVALLTLGIQLAHSKLRFKLPEAHIAVLMRLIGGPLLAFGIIRLVGLEGIPAQVIMISAGVPTAVNTVLIAVDADNYPEFAAQVVLTTTVLCGITLVATIYFAQMFFPA